MGAHVAGDVGWWAKVGGVSDVLVKSETYS